MKSDAGLAASRALTADTPFTDAELDVLTNADGSKSQRQAMCADFRLVIFVTHNLQTVKLYDGAAGWTGSANEWDGYKEPVSAAALNRVFAESGSITDVAPAMPNEFPPPARYTKHPSDSFATSFARL